MKIKKGFKKPLLVTAAAAMTFGCLGGVANFASSSLATFAASPSDPAYYKDGLAGLVKGFGDITPTATRSTETLANPAATVGTWEELKAAIANEVSTIKLSADITTNEGVNIEYSTTIDLDGHKITSTGEFNSVDVSLNTDDKVKIMNGEIVYSGAGESSDVINVGGRKNSELTLLNLDLTCAKSTTECRGIGVFGNGDQDGIVVNYSGTINSNGGEGIYSISNKATINVGEFQPVSDGSNLFKKPLTTVNGGLYSGSTTKWLVNANVFGEVAFEIIESDRVDIVNSYFVGQGGENAYTGAAISMLVSNYYTENLAPSIYIHDGVFVGTDTAISAFAVIGDNGYSYDFSNAFTFNGGVFATTNLSNPVMVFSKEVGATLNDGAFFGQTDAGMEYSGDHDLIDKLAEDQAFSEHETDDGTPFAVIFRGNYDKILMPDGVGIGGLPSEGDDGVESETPENPDDGLIGGGAGTTGGPNNNAGSNNPSGDSQKPNAGATDDKETTIAVPKTGANNKSAAASSIDTTGFIVTAVALLMLSLGYAGFRYFKNRY